MFEEKNIRWIGTSQADLRDFPGDACREAGFALYMFQKTTQKTSRSDIELSQQRYKVMLQQRQNQKE